MIIHINPVVPPAMAPHTVGNNIHANIKKPSNELAKVNAISDPGNDVSGCVSCIAKGIMANRPKAEIIKTKENITARP